jgi:hypothetical protein
VIGNPCGTGFRVEPVGKGITERVNSAARARASRTVTSCPTCVRSNAADRPANPAPTTSTRFGAPCRSGRLWLNVNVRRPEVSLPTGSPSRSSRVTVGRPTMIRALIMLPEGQTVFSHRSDVGSHRAVTVAADQLMRNNRTRRPKYGARSLAASGSWILGSHHPITVWFCRTSTAAAAPLLQPSL